MAKEKGLGLVVELANHSLFVSEPKAYYLLIRLLVYLLIYLSVWSGAASFSPLPSASNTWNDALLVYWSMKQHSPSTQNLDQS